ncbi:MAG: ATP-binding protein [Candidatus Omnitrophota bacterium]
MLIYSVPPLVSSLLFLALGLFVWTRKNRKGLNQSLGLSCLVTFWWQFSWVFLFAAADYETARLLARIGYSGIIFIPITLYDFYAGYAHSEKDRFWVKLSYGAGIGFLAALWLTDRFVTHVEYFFWGYYPRTGILHLGYLVFLFAIALRILFIMVRHLVQNHLVGKPKAQARIVLAAYLAFLPASADFLVNYGVEFYPFGFFFILVTLGLLAYAIIRHRLLDIEIIIRKTLVFTGLVGFVFAVFSAAAFLVRAIISRFFGVNDFWTYAISIFLIVLGFDPIRNGLTRLTDRYLFQRKYDYQKLLKDASAGISNIESLKHLFGLVTHFITMRMRVKNAALLTRQKNKKFFKLEFQRGYEKRYLAYQIPAESPLFQYLTCEKEAVDVDRIREYQEKIAKKRKAGEPSRYYDYQAILDQMQALEAVCCIPSFLGKDLRNILVLGPKKSGNPFTEEDLNVLYTLAQESAIAIENARLYDEAVQKAGELQNINEALEDAKLRLTQALKDTEAANKQLQDTQAQLIHEQKMATLGRLAASVGHEVNNPLTILSMNVSRAILKYRKDPDLKVSAILDVFQKMEQNISRIKAVVNTLTGLLKKSEKGRFEPLSLKLILEETLPLVQFQTYLDNLAGTEVEFHIPANIPLIRGDLERLQEVFLNLFINAYHAMSGRRNPRIEVRAEIDPAHPKVVMIHFSDNGKGMTDEVLKKIFTYGFTTKPPGKGSGLGLYMCKYIIELHGGSIKVTSRENVGTTFTLTLPVYQEESLSETTAKAESA